MKRKFIPHLFSSVLLSGATLITTASAQDASLVVAMKAQLFNQSSAVAPQLSDTEPPISFTTLVQPSAPGSILGATVEGTAIGVKTLVYDDNDQQFAFRDGFQRMNELQDAYPDGSYTVHLNTLNDGSQSMTVNVGGDSWTSAPRIANWSELQNFDSTKDFTLRWDAMVNGTVNDLIIVNAYADGSSQEFATGGPGEPGSLNGTATSVVIPAGTFSPGLTVNLEIDFARIVDQDPTYSGAFGAYLKVTSAVTRTAGGTDVEPPQLTNQSPWSGKPQVERDAVVSFTFNEPMQSGVAINWSGVSGAGFAYTWSTDKQTLYCRYNSDLPANTAIAWTLNPVGQPVGFKDLAGNAFPSNTGSFVTGASASPAGADVKRILLGKGRLYTQSGATAVGPGLVVASVDGQFRSLNAVTNGTFTLPDARSNPIEFNSDHSGLETDVPYGNQSDLDLFYPNGDYVVALDAIRDGSHSVTVSVTGDQYPNAPTISNLAAAQTINPAAPFTISWQQFAGGTASDFILLDIESEYGNAVFRTPDVIEAGALGGTATDVTLPVGTFGAGRVYHATLTFLRVSDSDSVSYPGTTVFAGYYAQTQFTIATTGTVVAPAFSNLTTSSSLFSGALFGDAGIPYTIESTSDFVSWNTITTMNVDAGADSLPFAFPMTGDASGRQFFRAHEGY